MLQDQLVEDPLYTGLSMAPQGWVGTIKEKSLEMLGAFKVVINMKKTLYKYHLRSAVL